MQRNLYPDQCHFLRRIEVDFQRAPERAIAQIQTLEPDLVICCGMAETRMTLSVESNGKFQDEVLWTPFDLSQVMDGAIATEISHDAGNFVCNYLYYSILKYIEESALKTRCLFVHVPILHEENLDQIVQDFRTILQNLLLDRSLIQSAIPASGDRSKLL